MSWLLLFGCVSHLSTSGSLQDNHGQFGVPQSTDSAVYLSPCAENRSPLVRALLAHVVRAAVAPVRFEGGPTARAAAARTGAHELPGAVCKAEFPHIWERLWDVPLAHEHSAEVWHEIW